MERARYSLLWCFGVTGALLSVCMVVWALILIAMGLATNTSQEREIDALEGDVGKSAERCETKFDELLLRLDVLANDTDSECVEGMCENFPNNPNPLNLLGCWNADGNVPLVVSGAGEQNDAYIVCDEGSTVVDGNDEWGVGDMLVFQESEGAWIKNDGTPEPCVLCDLVREEYVMRMEWDRVLFWPDFNITVTIFLLGDGFARMVIPDASVITSLPVVGHGDGPRNVFTAAFPIPENRRPITTYTRQLVTHDSDLDGGDPRDQVGAITYFVNGTLSICRTLEISDSLDGLWTNADPPNTVGWRSIDFIYEICTNNTHCSEFPSDDDD